MNTIRLTRKIRVDKNGIITRGKVLIETEPDGKQFLEIKENHDWLQSVLIKFQGGAK